ncbi:MAG: PVC-type heme-binding CxxCH protein [Chitinophagaceae bacterium]
MRKLIFLLIASGWLFHGCTNKMRTSKSIPAENAPNNQNNANDYTNKSATSLPAPRRGEVLFLGNLSKHHDSGKYAPWLAISLFRQGINITYTIDLNDLNTENLGKYDGLIIYANYDSLSASQEQALKEFVEGGKGLIPLHSASGCFKNSAWYLKTIGGQFKSHGVGTFTGTILNKMHPVMKGLNEFDTWDETYVHQNINPDMTVLMERTDGTTHEPYTWVRKQGKGRVFYTAYGHNDSTWKKAGFMKLMDNGVLWALGDEVSSQITRLNRPNVEIYSPEIESDFTRRHLVPKMQEALSPEKSEKLIQVPVDFEVKLFASEPDITNPIAMSWDEKGRLWIVESVDYPNTFLETDGAANDRIKICEDTNGDGKADKFTIFADKLNIPTSIVFANGGIVVSMAPYFVFLKDTDGDDKADIRENIMNGWDKGDTHFGPSNLQYGFDNKIWGVVGSGFTGTTKDGKNLNFRTGVYHVNPDGTDFEFLANTSNNTWGLGFSEENNVFISTANNTHSAYYSMPARFTQRALPRANPETMDAQSAVLPVQKIDGHYDVHSMTPNLRQVDVVGGFTAAAGHHMYTARNFPKEYWNRMAFVCEPTVRVLHNAIIEPKGSGFAEKDNWNMMASSDEWFGPVHAEVGPDGALWVADWYNFIIQHNVFVEQQAPSLMVLPFKEQPRGQGNAFISPLRDINFGRVYRVVYKKGKTYSPLKLSKDDLPGLLAGLENDNMFWRMTAQRLLVESKNQAAIPGLFKIISNNKVDEIGLNSPAVHALWTLQGLGALNGSNAEAMQVVIQALKHPAAAVRKAAVQVMSANQQGADAIEAGNLLNDPNLNVRMSAIMAMAAMPPSVKIGELIYAATQNAENAKDEWIPKALLAAAITHEEGFLAASGKKTAMSAASPEASLSDRINKAISQEIYTLPRRGTLLYSPDVTGKEIIIKGTINKGQRALQGVIMAQGGMDNGYGLYIQDGKINMVVNQAGITYKATSEQLLPEKFDVTARVSNNGVMSIEIDGAEVANAKAGSLFKQPLRQGVRVSQDVNSADKIAAYEGIFALVGNIQNATLELKKPGKDMQLPTKSTTAKPTATAKQGATIAKEQKAITISLKVVQNVMQYDKKVFTVKAGQKVIINFENPDFMQHNLVILKPGSKEKVGAAADLLASDPKGAQQNYVPKLPEVLFSTKLLTPQEEISLQFIAPAQVGDYPYICTFPGHWRIMAGIMKVVK